MTSPHSGFDARAVRCDEMCGGIVLSVVACMQSYAVMSAQPHHTGSQQGCDESKK